MKIKEARAAITRAAKLTVLSFVTAATLTGCSMSFSKQDAKDAAEDYASHIVKKAKDYAEDTKEDIENLDIPRDASALPTQIPVAAAEAVADIIDEANLKDDVDEVATKIKETIEDYKLESQLGQFEEARLVRVVDGDTIVVEIDNDYQAKVRLIGIDTPESVASDEYLKRTGKENSQAGIDASNFTKALLAGRDVVYLEKDTSDTDKYGRLLRFVWLEIPQDSKDLDEMRNKMLNAMLLDAGVANVATYTPDVSNADAFTEIAHSAQQDKYDDVFEAALE